MGFVSMFMAVATAVAPALATTKPRQAIIIIVNGDVFRLSKDIQLPTNQV